MKKELAAVVDGDDRGHIGPPPKEGVRANQGGLSLRRAVDATDGEEAPAATDRVMPTLFGHFTPFNRWTEIDSWFEGHFMERIAPGAFKKTIREQTPKVLFQHGGDPAIGDKVLGAPKVLREEAEGPYYEVDLLDTSYNRDLIPGLEAGLYGASFRMTVLREEWNEEPGVSEGNPLGIPERTIKEVRLHEFGPVTFPAYADATAGVRSLADELIIGRAKRDPQRLRDVLRYLERRDDRPTEDANTVEPAADSAERDDNAAPPTDRAEDSAPHSDNGRRSTPIEGLFGLTTKETKPWLI